MPDINTPMTSTHPPTLPTPLLIVSWILQLLAAAILLQTLFFKFTGAEESRSIFSTLGVEPWGRYAAGTAELIAAMLLLIPGLTVYGALLTVAIISGALLAHLTRLGIVVQGDHGLLFTLALITLLAAGAILAIRRHQIPLLGAALPTPIHATAHPSEPPPAQP